MSKTAILSVRILADAKKAQDGFKKVRGSLDKLEGKLKTASAAMGVASAGVIAFGKQALDAASDLQQSTGGVEAVFKNQADSIKALATDAANSVGLSANQYQEFATVMGAQLKNLGTAQSELVPTTEKLITMGADLASMYGGTTADAVSALSAVFRGETDPIEKYGISIKQSDVNARLAAKGLDKLEGDARRLADTQARMEILTEQSADALGNFARETDTAAGSAQIAAAHWENAKAALGEQLLPVATLVAEKVSALAQALGQHPEAAKAVAIAVLVVTGAVMGALAVIRSVKIATEAWAAAQAILNIVLAANPLGLLVIAIAAVIAALVLAYQKSESFRLMVDIARAVAVAAFRTIADWIGRVVAKIAELIARAGGIGGIFRTAMSIAATAVQVLMSPLHALIGLIGRVISAISGIRFPSPPGWMSRFFGGVPALTMAPAAPLRFMSAPPLTMSAAPPDITAARGTAALAARAGSLAPATGRVMIDQSVHITVDGSGIVDPRAVAEKIREVLRTDDRYRGRRVAAGVY